MARSLLNRRARSERLARSVGVPAALTLLLFAAACGSGSGATQAQPNAPADANAPATSSPSPTTHDHSPGMSHDGQADAAGAPMGAENDHGAEAYVPLDSATQKELSAQMARAREVTMQYPTVGEAQAAGFSRVGPFAPGTAAHYLVSMTDIKSSIGFNLEHPIIWLYAGNEPTSPVVGLMYFSIGATPPEGFAGPNDHWHQHSGLCLGASAAGDGIEIALPVDKDATKEQCDAVQGRFMATTGWMVHVWSAPGWESPVGVFSHDNPIIQCTDGTESNETTIDKGCKGLA